MKIKIKRNVFNVTSKDRIMFNGVCYILITQTIPCGYSDMCPTFPKTTFNKMFKEGKIKKSLQKYRSRYTNEVYDLYEFVEENT